MPENSINKKYELKLKQILLNLKEKMPIINLFLQVKIMLGYLI